MIGATANGKRFTIIGNTIVEIKRVVLFLLLGYFQFWEHKSEIAHLFTKTSYKDKQTKGKRKRLVKLVNI